MLNKKTGMLSIIVYECPQMSKLTKYNCQCDAKISNGTEFAAISCKLIERKHYESA